MQVFCHLFICIVVTDMDIIFVMGFCEWKLLCAGKGELGSH